MTLPTPLQLQAAKRAGKTITVAVAENKSVTLTGYLAARALAASVPPDTWFNKGFGGWGCTAAEALAEFQHGSLDRINLRAGIVYGKPMSPSRILANLKRTVKCECRWCGSALPAYVPAHARFCDASCNRSYHS